MKKNKGFTLIELLAVIVVLAIIALIAIPIITNVIDKARVGALKDSAYGILDAGEVYLASNLKDGIESNLTFTCTKNKCTSDDKEINYKGNINAGTLILTTDSKTLVCVDNGKNYALKLANEKEVTTGIGTCGSYEEENGSFNIISDIDTLKNELKELKEKLDQTDATAGDITLGKKAYTKGELVTGTGENGSIYFLGNGTTFNLTELQSSGKIPASVDLSKLSINNFISGVSSLATGADAYGVKGDLGSYKQGWSKAVFIGSTLSTNYDSSTGVLTLSGLTPAAQAQHCIGSGCWGATYSYGAPTYFTYLIIGDIKDISK